MRRESGIFRKSIVVLFVGMALFLSCGLSSSWAADLVAETGIKAVSTDWSVYDNIYINDGVTVTLAPGAHDLGAANLIIEEGGSVECAPLIANSQTSVSVGTGSKTFTVEAGLGFLAGQEVIINNRDARSQLLTMDGVVTSYASGSLIVDVSSASGSGAHGSWTIALKPSVIITTIGNIIINNGGMITALGMGYQGERGWQGYSEIYIAPYGLAPPTQMSGLYGSGGGGHGGRGGDGGYAQGGEPVYGSQSNPTTLGSGGGGGGLNTSNTWSEGGAGGGAIKLNVYGSLINNGIITSDGGQGHRVSTSELQYYPAAGGAGGSIWINTGALLGSGVISAKGGSAFGGGGTSSHVAGGGGGGRIACYYSNGGDSMTYNVSGGASSPNSNKPVASEGTVHIVHKEDYTITYLNQYQSNGKTKIDIGGLSDSQSAVFKLVMIASSSQKLTPQVEVKEVGVDFDGEGITSGFPVVYDGINPAVGIVNYTGLKFHPSTPLAYHWRARIKYADGSFSDWVSFGDNEESVADIKGAIGTNITADETWVTDKTYTNLYIGNNAKITIDSANKTGGAGQIVLTVDNLWVDSGSSISADAKGYRGGTYGSSSQYSEGLSALGTGRSLWSGNGSGGAGYGGTGGLSGQNSAGGITYGSITAPVDLGSGAGAAPASFGGAGGGAIKIIASGNITNNGIITVNGGGGTSPEATRGAGGGSGGSIWVITDRLDGSGIFSAKGGNGGESSEPTSYSGGGGGEAG